MAFMAGSKDQELTFFAKTEGFVEETYFATAGQTVFHTAYQYAAGMSTLNVLVNGVKALRGVDYLETDDTTITFISGLNLNDEVTFQIYRTTGLTAVGSADGPFVYCGFRPRYVLIKWVDAGPSNWTVHDTAREASNVQQAVLYPHLSNAEGVQSAIDVLSNGFKLRHSTSEQNGSGASYIFYAIAEQPFQYANAR